MGFNVQGMAWIVRDNIPILIMATDQGLYELSVTLPGTTGPNLGAIPIVALPGAPDQGFYAVATSLDVAGRFSVAVAAEKMAGVFLSVEGGRSKTFHALKMAGRDVRVLQVQKQGIQSFLWAGLADDDPVGKGCVRWELPDAPGGWQEFGQNWAGGSCQGIAFAGALILASSFDGGVLRLAAAGEGAQWEQPDVRSGLPQLSREHPFESVGALAADRAGQLLLAGTQSGIYSSRDLGKTYTPCSRKEFLEELTIPGNWLFCSGVHQVEVVESNGTNQD
jgi:hypothetical protein